MSDVKIRNATLEDSKIICGLFMQMRGENYDFETFKFAYEKKLSLQSTKIIVAEYDGNIVGVADISFHQYLVPLAMLLTIENIIVDENCRGKGIGKHLMNYIIEYAKNNNCRDITLTSGVAREKAHKFYEDYGFKKNGYRFDYKINE